MDDDASDTLCSVRCLHSVERRAKPPTCLHNRASASIGTLFSDKAHHGATRTHTLTHTQTHSILLQLFSPSFAPFGVAETWTSLGRLGASPVGGASARIERFFASWFVTAEATTSQAAKDFIGRVPAMITSGQFDVVATTLQTMPKEDLHVSFSTIAAEGWERSASFWEQAWRLARFFERVSNGSLMA